MAKSLRSKPKLRAKSIKRKGEFAAFVDGRNARLAEKDRQNLLKLKAAKEKLGEDDSKTVATDIADDADAMLDEPKDTKKVSTSGWRDSRSQIYKQRKIKKVTKSKTMKF